MTASRKQHNLKEQEMQRQKMEEEWHLKHGGQTSPLNRIREEESAVGISADKGVGGATKSHAED